MNIRLIRARELIVFFSFLFLSFFFPPLHFISVCVERVSSIEVLCVCPPPFFVNSFANAPCVCLYVYRYLFSQRTTGAFGIYYSSFPNIVHAFGGDETYTHVCMCVCRGAYHLYRCIYCPMENINPMGLQCTFTRARHPDIRVH